MMRLHCNRCRKAVSTPVPDDTIIRAWIECPECVEKYGTKVKPRLLEELLEEIRKELDKIADSLK